MHSNGELIVSGIEPNMAIYKWVGGLCAHYSLWVGRTDCEREGIRKWKRIWVKKSEQKGRKNAFERGMTVRPSAVELSGWFPEEKKEKPSKQTHLDWIHKQTGLTSYP